MVRVSPTYPLVVLALVALLGLELLGLERSAHAGACPSPTVKVWMPGAGKTFPINAEIRVRFVRAQVELRDVERGTQQIRKTSWAKAEDVTFRIHEVGGAIVPAIETRFPNAISPTRVIVPSENLKPKSTYNVVARHKGESYIIATISTSISSAVDEHAPTLEGVSKVRFRKSKRTHHRKDLGGPFAHLSLKAYSDKEVGALQMEIHELPEGEKASSATLKAFFDIHGDTLTLGKTRTCESGLHFVANSKAPGVMRIGVRARDSAGNQSALHIVEIPLPKSKRSTAGARTKRRN